MGLQFWHLKPIFNTILILFWFTPTIPKRHLFKKILIFLGKYHQDGRRNCIFMLGFYCPEVSYCSGRSNLTPFRWYLIPLYIYIWVFPKIGVGPPNHPLKNSVFHYLHHPFWGKTPYFLETSIYIYIYATPP